MSVIAKHLYYANKLDALAYKIYARNVKTVRTDRNAPIIQTDLELKTNELCRLDSSVYCIWFSDNEACCLEVTTRWQATVYNIIRQSASDITLNPHSQARAQAHTNIFNIHATNIICMYTRSDHTHTHALIHEHITHMHVVCIEYTNIIYICLHLKLIVILSFLLLFMFMYVWCQLHLWIRSFFTPVANRSLKSSFVCCFPYACACELFIIIFH